ncbi:chromosome segregation protein SMC [Mesorhizobium sp. B1-1-1]|uniref:AAA family ATPase n=1 Tax=Mesorhizobium sp. B1-1-1 TaxID=2589983 RepID=UPI00112A3C7F|nr:AAA family ATPase [Mesorhizobium sp. B1-1-1]TPN63621.1 chromosome segregation protein SMC [Mesorhizobium sp. B1-1-1]
MSNLYLRSVELSNFRIYGDSYAFELPDGPGVTLITGANGLGKTSFFDGVEWALTNQVSRFQDIPMDARRKEPDPLTRIGAPENSHRVSLQFSDGDPIDRGAGFVPDEGAIARLLKRPEWAEISNLHGYLSITHFLGQAATQRFSLRKPDKQWEALKGPAGVDRINALRERLSGLGVRRAFTRTLEERTKRLSEASGALAAWISLLAERDRAGQLSSSDQAVPPAALREAVELAGAQILKLVPDVVWSMPEPSTASESLLQGLADLLRMVEQRSVADAEAAEGLAKIAADFDLAGAETLTLRSMAQDIEQRRAAAVEKLGEVEAALSRATASLMATERQVAQAQGRSVTIARVRTALRQLEHSRSRRTEAAEQLARSAIETGRIETAIVALRESLERATAQRADRRALSDQVTLARRRAEISGKLSATRSEADRLTPLLASRQPVELQAQREALAKRDSAAQASIAQNTADLRAHDDRARAIAEAVSMIAHRLTHGDVSCPVCASEFPPGRLVELAGKQSAADTRPASQLATALADARMESEEVRRQIASVDRAMAELEQLQATMATLREREQELRQHLVEAGGSASGIYDQSQALLLEQELMALDAQLAVGETPEQIEVRLKETEAVLKAELTKRVTIQRSRDSADEDSEAAQAALRQHAGIWTDDKGLLVDLDAEQASIDRELADLASRISSDRAVLDNVRLTRDDFRESEARETQAQSASNARLDALAAARAALLKRWTNAGQSGEPDAARVAQNRARFQERVAQLGPLRAMQQQLVAGYRKWLSDEQLRRLEERIAEIAREEDVSTELEVRPRLEERVDEAHRALEVAQRARDRIDAVGSQLQERAESYADEVLFPLNATIQRFARTLMTWADASIIYRAEHHVTRSELRPGIVRSEADGTVTQLEMNPNLYFSEGQLSALSVAALFAASTTFGWSRWRGLLLDDPLQHNDVIHASAFMDLIRQMVRELGYQVILSTHDSSEAEFLGRKCLSAGIPYYVHDLVPQGEGGLISKVA